MGLQESLCSRLCAQMMREKFRSDVGILFYLIKHSRPDLLNVVFEISKCMDSASDAAYKEMIRVIIFVFGYERYLFEVEVQPG
jgi:hypothetical protein